MLIPIPGIINGKRIELERETGLPAGSTVIVRIQPKPLSLADKRRLVDLLCGVWANDASLKAIFAEIERRRASSLPREVNFHTKHFENIEGLSLEDWLTPAAPRAPGS